MSVKCKFEKEVSYCGYLTRLECIKHQQLLAGQTCEKCPDYEELEVK